MFRRDFERIVVRGLGGHRRLKPGDGVNRAVPEAECLQQSLDGRRGIILKRAVQKRCKWIGDTPYPRILDGGVRKRGLGSALQKRGPYTYALGGRKPSLLDDKV